MKRTSPTTASMMVMNMSELRILCLLRFSIPVEKAIEAAVKETILQMREVSYEVFGELIAMKIRLEMVKYRQNL